MSRHQSVDRHVKKSLKWLCSIDGVSRYVIGISECCRHKYPPGFLKFKMNVEAGFTINAYSGNGVTHVFVQIVPIGQREQIKSILAKRFDR